MAEIPGIKAEVTDAIHAAFRDVAQNIFDQHGIIVKDVMIDWIDLSTVDRRACRVHKVETRATKVYIPES